MVTTHSPFQLTYAAPPPTSEAFNEYYTYTYPFSSMRDQESQTEWTYESKPGKGNCTLLVTMHPVSLWD